MTKDDTNLKKYPNIGEYVEQFVGTDRIFEDLERKVNEMKSVEDQLSP